MGYFCIIIGYLLGSIPFGLLFGKCQGVDVRAAGSGNIGATNVNRLLGKKLGFLTLLADAVKAVVPMLLTAALLQEDQHVLSWVAFSGGAAFLGHLYPLYLKFKGGKGVATALGVFLYLQPLAALVCVLIFVGIVKIWGYVSLGSLVAAALMPLLIILMKGPMQFVWLSAFIAMLIWLKHHANIKRLLSHTENRIKGAGVVRGKSDAE